MTIGIVGIKCGMTRIFTEDGTSHPVTVIHADPNKVVQVKSSSTREGGVTEGYDALQVTMGIKKVSRVSKPVLGHYRKAGIEPGKGLWEFRVENSELESHPIGSALTVKQFEAGQKVDVTGVSKGKGFQGGVKRHNFAMQDATHGNSVSHRAIGSTGQNQTPGRVFKGKKMPGQMGNKRCTVQTLEVVAVDVEKHLISIKGGLPGAAGSVVIVKPAVKAKKA